MRILVIDDEALAQVKRVKEFALAHRISIHDLMRTLKNKVDIPGNDINRFVEFFDGWKVVYTVEQQPDGWFHHVSISVTHKIPTLKSAPNIPGSTEILKLFSLPEPQKAACIFLEDLPNGNKAVNILYPFIEQPSNEVTN